VKLATSPILTGAATLGTCVQSQFREINYETAHGKTPSQAEGDVYQNLWGCVAGPIFWGAVALFAILAIILAIVEGFTLGAGFLVSLAIGLIITGVLSAVQHSNVNIGPVETSNLSGSHFATFAEGFANNTTHRAPSTNNSTQYVGYNNNNTSSCSWSGGNQSNLSGCSYGESQQQVWGFIAGTTVLLLDYKGANIGLQDLKTSLATNNVWVKAFNWVGMALSVISIVMDLAALVINPEPRFSAFGLAIGIAAIVMNLGSLAYQKIFPDLENPLEIEDGVGIGLAFASTGISAVMYADGY